MLRDWALEYLMEIQLNYGNWAYLSQLTWIAILLILF